MNRAIVDKALESLFLAGGCGATELLLIRHAAASSSWDDAQCRLTPSERDQAHRLGQELTDGRLAAVYCAATPSSTETAQILADEARCQLEVVPGLAPIAIAPAEEPWMTGGFALAVDAVAQRFCCCPRWDSVPSAENGRLFRRRAIQAVESVAARHQGETVALVTHDCVINAYLSMVLDIPRDMFFVPSPVSVSAVRIKGDRYGVQCINSQRPPGVANTAAVPSVSMNASLLRGVDRR